MIICNEIKSREKLFSLTSFNKQHNSISKDKMMLKVQDLMVNILQSYFKQQNPETIKQIFLTKHSAQHNIRELIYARVFPNFSTCQLFLTYLTGCPHQGQKPIFLLSSIHYIILYISSLILGIGIGWWFFISKLYLLLPLAWIITLGGVAGCNLGLIHQASHLQLTRRKIVDFWIGRILSAILITVGFDDYTVGHRYHHRPATHQTDLDNTLLILQAIDFKPGLPVAKYWQCLWKLVDPLFMGRFFLTRLMKSFVTNSLISKYLTWLIWLSVAILVAITHNWLPFTVSYLVPVLILYPPIYILRHTVEHKAPSQEIIQKRNKLYIALSTDAVFLGEAPPEEDLMGLSKFLAWSGWWSRMLFWHGLIRWLVCPADVPVHDYHTRMAGHPREDWPNALWHRQRQQDAGCPGWPILYTEQWGFITGMNEVFESFSNLPQDYNF